MTSSDLLKANLQERLRALPTRPGVYLMKDAKGEVIYVGKAISLRDRVRSYFASPSGQTEKVRRLVAHITDFDVMVTDSELEALILECNLIKRHRPHYNVRMKDDKTYPYLRIDVQNTWPKVTITRRMEKDGARYFGPYADTGSVRRTLELLKKLFPYCNCNRVLTGNDKRACLDYHIGRCLGPCIGACTTEEYRRVIDQVILFLEGKQETVVKQLRARMEQASEELQFERAAHLRDRIFAVERVVERQKITSAAMADQDIVALARSNGDACVEVFFVRSGKLIGQEHFMLEGTQEEGASEILSSFLKQFYDSASHVPREILLESQADEMSIIESWLRNKRGSSVVLKVPRRGEKKKLVEMVAQNAVQALEQMRLKWMADSTKMHSALEELREQLNLPALPDRIECYDISNIQGTAAVGSMVVFEKGHPKRAHYRRFKIKTVQGANDYASLQEVLRRRFKRGKLTSDETDGKGSESGKRQSSDAWAIYPDLVLIDGGKGQLRAGLEVLQDLGIDTVPVASLAKENEELFVPTQRESILLRRNSGALFLVQRLRDEAHRFAITYHQKERSRQAFQSALDDVPGIGPRRKRALIKEFGSIQRIKSAHIDDLAAVPGMTRALAQRVKEKL
ncbi:MAG: excinuclease ABC subunit UvrC [Chloroflexota bacterium]|nr:MAG: excinuclease ABC subunit UvrC [Chloroflexota bacterium]